MVTNLGFIHKVNRQLSEITIGSLRGKGINIVVSGPQGQKATLRIWKAIGAQYVEATLGGVIPLGEFRLVTHRGFAISYTFGTYGAVSLVGFEPRENEVFKIELSCPGRFWHQEIPREVVEVYVRPSV